MGLLQTATTATQAVTTLVSGSPASSLSVSKDPVTGAATASGSSKSTLLTAPALPNVLSSYATYDYILGLSVLKPKEYNSPDTSYMKGRFSMPLICKSANSRPNDRIRTAYGQFDFFIESLVVDSVIGFQNYKNSSVQVLNFDVVEPYSALMFPLALQTAAKQAGYGNWREAPFLLTVEFRGNKENGTMQPIPNVNRYIPIKLQTMQINVSEKGTSYHVTAVVYNDSGKTAEFSEAKTDISIKGKTIQEILQTGEQSLQAVLNKRLQKLKEKKIVNDPDEIIILFPEKIESEFVAGQVAGEPEKTGSATTQNVDSQSTDEIKKKLGVSEGANKTLVQPDGQVNAIGKAKSGADLSRKAKTPLTKPSEGYQNGTVVSANVTYDPAEGTYTFAQTQDIPAIINEVILSSDFVTACLDKNKIDSRGMRGWWTIDTQVYHKSTTANLNKTGTVSRIIVYRVYPYQAHSSTATNVNTKAQGFDVLEKTVVKRYDYIYTGKNTEVLKFDIDYSVSFSNILASDANLSNIDAKRAVEEGNQEKEETEITGITTGNQPSDNTNPTSVKPNTNMYSSDVKGGSLPDTSAHRVARAFHDALTRSVDMMILNLEIVGDPFWLPTSGMGNYTAPEGDRPGVTKDNSVDYQRTQIDVYVNFRTPLDVNQSTGLYDFGKWSSSGPVVEFSGLYNVLQTTSTFKNGRFTQVLKGNRREGQERKKTDTPEKVQTTSQPTLDKDVEKLDYESEKNSEIDP